MPQVCKGFQGHWRASLKVAQLHFSVALLWPSFPGKRHFWARRNELGGLWIIPEAVTAMNVHTVLRWGLEVLGAASCSVLGGGAGREGRREDL